MARRTNPVRSKTTKSNPSKRRRVVPGSKAARTGAGRPKISRKGGGKIADVGRPGKGPKTITIGTGKEELFGPGFAKKPLAERMVIVRRAVRKVGPTTVIRAATGRRNLFVNKDPVTSRRFKAAADQARSEFGTDANPKRGSRSLSPKAMASRNQGRASKLRQRAARRASRR